MNNLQWEQQKVLLQAATGSIIQSAVNNFVPLSHDARTIANNVVPLEEAGTGLISHVYKTRQYLHTYFDVSHSYVLRKLMLLLFPLLAIMKGAISQGVTSRTDKRISLDNISGSMKNRGRNSFGGEGNQPSNNNAVQHDSGSYVGSKPTRDPDLYIPCIAFISYVILHGWSKATMNAFEPKVLSERATLGICLAFGEAAIYRLLRFLTSAPQVSFIDILSNVGYKYVHISVIVAASLVCQNQPLYTVNRLIYVYCAFCSCSVPIILSKENETRQDDADVGFGRRNKSHAGVYMNLLAAFLQVPLIYLLTPTLGQPSRADTK